MESKIIAWISLLVFAAIFMMIALWGRMRSKDAAQFATGSNAGPLTIGMSLATTLTSAAVFIVNPGLVYHYGLSAFLSFSVAANLGIILGLSILLKGFRNSGINNGILSVPQWIQTHYQGGNGTRLFYGLTNLLLFAYIVLIFVGLTNVITQLLGVDTRWTLGIMIAFIFIYNQIGGASSHVYTNLIQGVVMVLVAIVLVGSGIHLFDGGLGSFFSRLEVINPILVKASNPGSIMFRDGFEVFAVNILIGFAIVCQPHILAKGLFLKNNRDVNKMLITAMVIGTVFSSVMFVGFFARLTLEGQVLPDLVIPQYIVTNFGTFFQILASIGILCAGISTLEAILLSFTVTYGFDILMPIASSFKLLDPSKREDQLKALKFGKWLTILSGVLIYFLTYGQIMNPNVSVALFAFNGVYALFAANFIPIAAKIFKVKIPKIVAIGSSALVLIVHFGMSTLHLSIPGLNPFYWTNPGATATFALCFGLIFATTATLLHNKLRPA